MASRVQKRRGTKAEHDAFTTGASGELTVEIPSTRASAGATLSTSAIHVHHGDGAVGDRFSSDLELNRTIREYIDEQSFFAKITGWEAINDDGSSATPDSIPSKWYYHWEEVEIGNLATTGTAQVAVISINATATVNVGGSNDDLTFKFVNSDNSLVTVTVDVDSSQSESTIASNVRSALDAVKGTGSLQVDYTFSEAADNGGVQQITCTCVTKGERLHPTVTIGSDISNLECTIAVTPGTSFVARGRTDTGVSTLQRRSNPGGGTHTYAAVNLCEITNTADYVGPGLRVVAQSANSGKGTYPDAYRVMPIGGSSNFTSGTGLSVVTGTGSPQVNQIVEMRERRKLDTTYTVGAVDNDDLSASSIHYNVPKFYYFQMPNVIMGPCS